MGPGQYVEILAGIAVLILTFYDLFQSIVLPRPSIYRLPLISRRLSQGLWRAWRRVGRRRRRQERRESFLAAFGPALLLVLLAFWGLALVLGFGLLLDGLRDQFEPPLRGFLMSLYLSGTTLLPLGASDIVPSGGAARLVILVETAAGVVLVAAVITLLFSLHRSFQAREELVVMLDALAGAPPSGLQILETAAAYPPPERCLDQTFDDWKRWMAAVLESHLAYPMLFYFRSSHDNEAWLNSFGAVMDAATLFLGAIEYTSGGAAQLMTTVGNHLVEDVAWAFDLESTMEVGVERHEFEAARARLQDAGYRCRDPETGWAQFADRRRRYASTLNQLADWLAIMPAAWIGESTYLPHRRPSP